MQKKCFNCKEYFLARYYDQRFCDNCHITKRKKKKKQYIRKYKLCKKCKLKEPIGTLHYCEDCRGTHFKKANEDIKKSKKEYEKGIYYKTKDNPILGIKKRLIMKIHLRKKYNNDKNHRVGIRLRNNLNQALKKYAKDGKISSSKQYGINYMEIIEKLKPFPEDISKYQIDHIEPCCSFNLEDKEQVRVCFSKENLRWLKTEDNLKKIKEDKKKSRMRGVQ